MRRTRRPRLLHMILLTVPFLVGVTVPHAALSDPNTPTVLTALDFDETTGTLTASDDPVGVHPPAYYFLTPATEHLVSVIHILPPNPCDGLGRAWDMVVEHQQAGGKDEPRVFIALLTSLAAHQCTITSTFDGEHNLLTIAPGS